MDERREEGLCFNCGNKYSKIHKCSERKFVYIDCEEEEYEELESLQDLELKEINPPYLVMHWLASSILKFSI
jgi:hypothetical protein